MTDLVVSGVKKSFGGLRAVDDVSFTVQAGSIFGLIGPNGAGKTTMLNLVTGVYPCDAGTIRLGDVPLSGKSPAAIASAGVARTFQNIRLFSQMTALENLLVARELHGRAGLFAAVVRTRAYLDDEATARARAHELLDACGLASAAGSVAATLAYGDQRRLEIARAMMTQPKLLLLDEPAAGMNAREADALVERIRWLRGAFGVAVVLVEHNMRVVMAACEQVHVLDHGETLAHGTPAEVRAHRGVLAAYLGDEASA